MAEHVLQWARAMCLAPSRFAGDMADSIGLDTGSAQLLGSQWIFDPPPQTSYCEFVVDDDDTVLFAEFMPDTPVLIEDLVPVLGEAHMMPPAPHDISPTAMFDLLVPPGAGSACRVTVRCRPAEPQTTEIETIYLHPRPLPDGDPGEG